MRKVLASISIFFWLFNSSILNAQTWVDSMASYAHESYLPAKKFSWIWQHAALLHTFTRLYEQSDSAQKEIYFNYIKGAMDGSNKSNARRPNTIAPAVGVAFLARYSNDEKYRKRAEAFYQDYLDIPKTKEGAVTHLKRSPQLWDDTVYMIGIFLLEMYRLTGDDKYLNDLLAQIRIHRTKLLDESTGLWVHGWDGNSKNNMAVCGQRSWPDKTTRRSTEIWGRGNGWVVVTLSEILNTLPQDHELWEETSSYLKEMVVKLPKWQDSKTGHWRQLTVKPDLEGNFIESSSTAMFAYGILTALKYKLVDEKYSTNVSQAYNGLKQYSLQPMGEKYYNTKNVCQATCIGDEAYYLNRKVTNGKPYALGMFILFGTAYEKLYRL